MVACKCCFRLGDLFSSDGKSDELKLLHSPDSHHAGGLESFTKNQDKVRITPTEQLNPPGDIKNAETIISDVTEIKRNKQRSSHAHGMKNGTISR